MKYILKSHYENSSYFRGAAPCNKYLTNHINMRFMTRMSCAEIWIIGSAPEQDQNLARIFAISTFSRKTSYIVHIQ